MVQESPPVVVTAHTNGAALWPSRSRGTLLCPMRPLNLRECQTVRIQVLPEASAEAAESEQKLERILQGLVVAEVLTPSPCHSDVEPLSEGERREQAGRLGQMPGKPLSEITISVPESLSKAFSALYVRPRLRCKPCLVRRLRPAQRW